MVREGLLRLWCRKVNLRMRTSEEGNTEEDKEGGSSHACLPKASLSLPLSEGEREVPLRPSYLGDTKHGSTLIIYICRWELQPGKAYQDLHLYLYIR